MNPVASPLVVAVVAAGLLAAVWLIYRQRVRSLPAPMRHTLLTLRFATAFVLISLLLRPTVEWTQPDDRAVTLLIAADSSRSMGVRDAGAGKDRRTSAQAVIERIVERASDAEDFTLQAYDFDSELRPVERFTSETNGTWTDLGTAIDGLVERNRDDRVVGAVLLSDGASRTPRPGDAEAIAASQSFVEAFGVPITPIGFGSSTLTSEGVDLAVADVLAEPTTFEKKVVRVRANVRVRGLADRPVTVRLLIENADAESPIDPTDLTAGFDPLPPVAGARPTQSLTVGGANETVPVDLSFLAAAPGEYRVRVLAEPDGEEGILTNNYRDVLIRVRRGGLRVLYLDAARWEQKFIRLVNDSSKIQLDYVFVPNREAFAVLREQADWFDTAEYDVFLIGDLPADVLQDSGRLSIADDLAAAVRRGAGVGLIAGPRIARFPLRGPLAKLMPADFTGGEPRPLDGGKRLYPTPEGLSHFVMQLGGQEVFDRLPPLERIFPVEPVNEVVDVLAETDTGLPLVAAAEAGRGRTMVVAMSDTWLWYRSGNPTTHQRFWQQMLLWLGRKEADSDPGLQVAASPRQVDLGEAVRIAARVVDETGGTPTDGSTISLELVRPDGEAVALTEGGRLEESRADVPSTDLAGGYQVVARRIGRDGTTIEEATTRFLVNATDPELDDPAADFAMLDRIAIASGGVTIAPEQVDTWLDELIESLSASESIRREIVTLWDGWPPLLLLASLLTAEWFLRKRAGLV